MDRIQRSVLLTMLANVKTQIDSIESLIATFASAEDLPPKSTKIRNPEQPDITYTTEEEDAKIEQLIAAQKAREETVSNAWQEASSAGQEQAP